MALGERRAQTVTDYLVALGIQTSRIQVMSYGKERPFTRGHDDRSWSQNRRAHFVVTAK
jgi:peptidoglycan-associated lipoprotein